MKALDDLLPLLDEEIELLQKKLLLMEEMQRCVRDGKLGRLEELLLQEGHLETGSAQVERRRAQLREKIAACAGVEPGEITLGRLAETCEGPIAIALGDRRERLLFLTQQLREKSEAMARIIRPALEVGNRLLAAMVGEAPQGETYSSCGEIRRARLGGTFHHSA